MMEKATRILTDEDKAMMEKAIEGKNGELRKIEVGHVAGLFTELIPSVYSGSTKAEEDLPIRGEIPGDGPQGELAFLYTAMLTGPV
jgi:hypothetical protein